MAGLGDLHEPIPVDVVEYTLFPSVPANLQHEHIDDWLNDKLESYLTQLSPDVIKYLWQKESFELRPVRPKGYIPACLQGKTNYGGNIDDEWFIVYQLFQLTKMSHGLIASVQDDDGEFLLVQAADFLPKWLEPDTAENRIFIFNGELHIIPITEYPAQKNSSSEQTLTLTDALRCIRDPKIQTKASPQIQNSIKKKLNMFPEKANENLHFANCYIPTSVAAVLEQNPTLVSPAVEAFYYRDPIDLQACRTMKIFQQEDMVIYRVKFTRYMYAQLLQQDFQPDRRSGWTLPSKTNPQFKQDDLGLKLAHGFEILCSRSGSKNYNINGHTSFNESDSRWQRYLKSLTEKGFFQNVLEGSRYYKVLLEEAKSFYTEHFANHKSTKKEAGDTILQLLESSPYSMEDFKKKEHSLPLADDDSWLEISPDELDQLLHDTVGKNTTNTSQQDTFDLSQITENMKSFVNNISSVEGAEFPEEGDDDDDKEVQFDGMGFIHAMQKMFDFPEDKDDDSDDMDEYGWEEDDSEDEFNPSKFKLNKPKTKIDTKMKHYMNEMDRELAKTEMGKSFEKTPKPAKVATKPQPNAKPKPKPKPGVSAKPRKTQNIDDEDDDFRPVNIDLTLVKNTLESYSAQQGLPGPATNILNSMGINIPKNTDV
ncbi:protein ecdysoneless homolog [Patella vulgata]|uniref:protein ecdysoneless homolog n=1 Tax=Patella vulgata TaxID=6465 RepID=UPI0024A8C3FC|nr:protein ecdysoneless homolog [Patella vulgata]